MTRCRHYVTACYDPSKGPLLRDCFPRLVQRPGKADSGPMQSNTRRSGRLAVVALVLAGCTGGTTGTAPTPTSKPATTATIPRSPDPSQPVTTPAGPVISPSATLVCSHHLAGHPPGADQQVVLGVVALSASPRSAALQAARDPSEPSATRYFAKDGLLVRAGASFDLVVPPNAGYRASVGWGGELLIRTRHLRVFCPHERTPSAWQSYVGGYWTDRPACLRLLVHAHGKQQLVRIGVGTPCPGQRPPSPM